MLTPKKNKNPLRDKPQSASKDFHHVTFRVEKLYPMIMVRDQHQKIVALSSVKMTHARAKELAEMVNTYLENYKEGGDMFTFTMEGEFT